MAAFAGSLPLPRVGIEVWAGDLDRDGRDDVVFDGLVHALVGGQPSPLAITRGNRGATSVPTRPLLVDAGAARIGGTLYPTLRAAGANALAFMVWGGPADQDLAGLGAPGNHAYVNGIGSLAMLADGVGVARPTVAVPAVPALAGTTLTLQFAVADPLANALGLATSNALDLTVGF